MAFAPYLTTYTLPSCACCTDAGRPASINRGPCLLWRNGRPSQILLGTCFLMPKISANLKRGHTQNGGARCRWGTLNAGELAENWRLSTRSVVNLARSQVCHSAIARFFCQRQLILFTARRNARIASAVLAVAIMSVCPSVRPSVRLSVCVSHAGIVSKRRHVARCSLHCQIAKCV